LKSDESSSSIGICDTRGYKQNKVTNKQVEDTQQKLARLAIPKLESDKNDSHIEGYDINDWKRDEAKKKRVEAIRKKLVLLNKTEQPRSLLHFSTHHYKR